uniref:Ig-like domain-containing protein n=1 Tax=Xiphophorus couchianus TaxID=32473 RepID=A0A3B5LU95_9TELE
MTNSVCAVGVPLGPKLVQGPDNITVTMGTEVSMQCTVRGFPVPMVHWFKDGCLLSRCSAAFSLLNNGQLLILRSDTPEDSRETFSFLLEYLKNIISYLLIDFIRTVCLSHPDREMLLSTSSQPGSTTRRSTCVKPPTFWEEATAQPC